ncbi:MAG: NYN domain-containing protein [Campylobacterales bacterium]|nr:NYN domain-containing protein [Campylobacterales bacterium]
MNKDVVVLYDVENMSEPEEFKKILALVHETILNGEQPYLELAYADWGNPLLQENKLLLLGYGITPQQVISHGWKGQKNAADIALCVDAMEILIEGSVKKYIIATGDGGFVSLVSKLRKHKKEVVIVSTKKSLAFSLLPFADKVYTTYGLVKAPEISDKNKESEQPYFKAIWAIAKTYGNIDVTLDIIFKNKFVREQLNSGGLKYELLERCLHNAAKYPITQIRKRLYMFINNTKKVILIRRGVEIFVMNATKPIDKGSEILNWLNNGVFEFRAPLLEGFSKDYVYERLLKDGYKISRSHITGEILAFIIENYGHFKRADIENLSAEIAGKMSRQKALVKSALDLVVFLNINAGVNKRAICKGLGRYLAGFEYHRNKNSVYKTICEDVFGWVVDEVES